MLRDQLVNFKNDQKTVLGENRRLTLKLEYEKRNTN